MSKIDTSEITDRILKMNELYKEQKSILGGFLRKLDQIKAASKDILESTKEQTLGQGEIIKTMGESEKRHKRNYRRILQAQFRNRSHQKTSFRAQNSKRPSGR